MQTDEAQNIFDLAIQTTGDISGLFNLLALNPNINLATSPISLNINTQNIQIAEPNMLLHIQQNNLLIASDRYPSTGGFSNDYNTDFN